MEDNSMEINRRKFLGAGLAALAVGAGGLPKAQGALKMPPVCVFSKHLQFLDYPALAKACKKMGLDGIDLTVRKGGHVDPRNVERDLPEAVAAIRGEGLEVSMITTSINSGKGAETKRVLEAASKEGIRYYRIGGHKYDAEGDPLETLKEVIADLTSLAKLNEALGMVSGYHNHSGMLNVGAPVWDLLRVYEAVGSPTIGSNFDMGHAVAEGPYGDWQITARALAPHTHMMAAKDFVYEGNKPRWLPIGEGVVPFKELFTIAHHAGFNGPVSVHFENPEFKAAPELEQYARIEAAAGVIRKNLGLAGYA